MVIEANLRLLYFIQMIGKSEVSSFVGHYFIRRSSRLFGQYESTLGAVSSSHKLLRKGYQGNVEVNWGTT